MIKNPRSLFAGAAVAASLIFPSMISAPMDALAGAKTPTAAMPAKPAAANPVAPPAQTNGNWVRWAPRSYNGKSLKIKDVVGTVTIAVGGDGPMMVEASGNRNDIKGLSVSNDDGTLLIKQQTPEDVSVWDVGQWFNFSDDSRYNHASTFVKVTVPRGMAVQIEDLVGNANVGDTYGELHLGAATTKAHVGHVGEAHFDLDGAGRIDVAAVDGDLHLDVGGSGKFNIGPVKGAVHADIAGSGDATFATIGKGMHLDIAGSGDITAARVDGPVRVEIAGSGSVQVADGTADPLHVEIMGAGNFVFGGVAVDPHIEALGSGTVKLKSYRGHMDSEGMANVSVGGNPIHDADHDKDDKDDDDQ